jgi:hypothetical protein
MTNLRFKLVSTSEFQPYNCLTMHFFHPRFSSTQPLKSAPEPCSEWAKVHAVQVSQWPKTLVSISDSRSSAVDFLALQHAVEAAMGQACIAIEWVTEGGANQVCLSPSALRYKTNIRIELYLITLFDGHQILARIAFPFPHRVHTGDAFAHQEDGDRARIPSKMQSEGCYLRQV